MEFVSKQQEQGLEHSASWIHLVGTFVLEMPSICLSMASNSDPVHRYFQSVLPSAIFFKCNILSFLQTFLTNYVKQLFYCTSWKGQCEAVDSVSSAKKMATSRFELHVPYLVVLWPWTSYVSLWTFVFSLNNAYNFICLNWFLKGRICCTESTWNIF